MVAAIGLAGVPGLTETGLATATSPPPPPPPPPPAAAAHAAAAQTSAADSERSLPRLVVCVAAGDVAEDILVDKVGLADLSETGLATPPSPPPPPPPTSAHVATAQPLAVVKRCLPSLVMRLAGDVAEDELVDKLGLGGLAWLRGKGLLTYPSPLVGRLLEKLPLVFAAEVLPWLDPADRAVVAQVALPWLAAVVSSGLTCAGKSEGVPLKLVDFIGSAGRLAWAKANGCPWDWQAGRFRCSWRAP